MYDGFILDQYGVLHNGEHPLPGVLETLRELKQKSKKLIILSNTSSPAKSTLDKLRKLGFDPEWFDSGAVTGGEQACHYVSQTFGQTFHERQHDNDHSCDVDDGTGSKASKNMKKKAIFLTYDVSFYSPPPLDFIKGCGNVEIAKSVEEADFVVAHGAEVWYQGDENNVPLEGFMTNGSFEVLGPILDACRKKNLPMICPNPDFIVRFADNSIGYMPGTMAQYYENSGGNVVYFGKPYPNSFEACIQKLGLDKSKVAHVGDSMHHDVAGAVGAGIASVFVTSGIHSDDLKTSFGKMPSQEELEMLFDGSKITPTHVIPAFTNTPV